MLVVSLVVSSVSDERDERETRKVLLDGGGRRNKERERERDLVASFFETVWNAWSIFVLHDVFPSLPSGIYCSGTKMSKVRLIYILLL